MLYLVGGEWEKESGSIKNFGKCSNIHDEMCPDIAVFTNGFDILQNILSVTLLLLLNTQCGIRIWVVRSKRLNYPENYQHVTMYQNLIGQG